MKMDTHHVEYVASSRTSSANVPQASGMTASSADTAQLAVTPVTPVETAPSARQVSTGGQTTTAVGTSAHSGMSYPVTSVPHAPPTIPSTNSTSSHLRMVAKSSSTTPTRTTLFASMVVPRKREEKLRNHISSLIVEPGSMVSTT